MVAASRTMICVTMSLVAMACGVVLPAAEDHDDTEPSTKDPVTTKGASIPAPGGADGDAGVSVNGTPGGPAEGGTAPQPGARTYAVFVTSQVWSADEIGGLGGADLSCANLANAVPALSGKKWAAWLSDGTASALARLGTTPGPWSRPDGAKVAQDRNQLVHPLLPLFTSIAVDERRAFHFDSVWTGTHSDGSNATDVCGGWTGTNGRGVIGDIDFKKPDWTSAADVDCDGDDGTWGGGGDWGPPDGPATKLRHRIYCFEID